MTATVSTEDVTQTSISSKQQQQQVESPTSAIGTTSKTTDLKIPQTPISNETYTLPKCILPPLSELEPIETFVLNAVRAMHEENPEPAHLQGYRAIIDTLRRPNDSSMIRNVLISLRTAGNGTVLTLIAGDATKHAQLIHVIFRFNSVRPPKANTKEEGTEEKAREEEKIKVYKEMHVMDAHLHLMLALVSAKPTHTNSIMKNVWKMLTYFPRDVDEEM